MTNFVIIDNGNWNFYQLLLSWIMAFDKILIAVIHDYCITHYFEN